MQTQSTPAVPPPTGCCPPSDPAPWQDQEINWNNKPFVKDHVTCLFHVPLNMGRVIVKDMAQEGVGGRWHRALLTCGILAPLLYVAMTLFVGLLWEGYSVASNVPSELSAIGAPTRTIWILLGTVYGVLMIAFGWIVWASAPNRALGVVGALLVAHTAFGQFWPPMHQRAVLAAGGGTLTDTLHLAWAAVTGIFFVLIVGFGAAAFGKKFRLYSIATMVIGLACGAVTGTYAAAIHADLPTPWVGIWERISIVTFMAWVVVLAITLLRARQDVHT
jgi:hypothetical protein